MECYITIPAREMDNLVQELNHMKIDIMGIAETRWTDTGNIVKDDYNMICYGDEDHKKLSWNHFEKWSGKIFDWVLANVR